MALPGTSRIPFVAATALFAAGVAAVSWLAGEWRMAVYALGVWHYVVYALAFFRRAVSAETFQFDAILLKGVWMLAFAFALAQNPPGIPAIAIMAAGFGLNIAAAYRLGRERTFYGHELTDAPYRHVAGFPYSLTAHPMLYGNILAYAGLFLDTPFRDAWWPLAALHVGLNALVLAMETRGRPGGLQAWLWPVGFLTIGSILFLFAFRDFAIFAAVAIGACWLFLFVLVRRYGAIEYPSRLVEKLS